MNSIAPAVGWAYDDAMEQAVEIRVKASQMRRIFAALMFAMLSILLIKMSFDGEGPLWGRALLLALSGVLIAAGYWFWSATRHALELVGGELRLSNGQVLALIRDVQQVERGTFAMKPAGGFTLIMKNKTAFHWAPGLWWSLGRRVAVGGAVQPGYAKAMAQMIEAKIADQEPFT